MKIVPATILIIILLCASALSVLLRANTNKKYSNNAGIGSGLASRNPSSCPCNKSSPASEAGQVLGQSAKLEEYRVPILMYHYIRDYNDPNDPVGTNLSVSPRKFEEQLKWLKDNRYQTISPDDLSDPNQKILSQISNSNLKSVILTFDDGYIDAYTDAFPILKKYGFTATFYIITAYINNNDRYMNWNEIRELKEAGMTIGSHTITHPSLDKSYNDRLNKELVESKEIIEEKVEGTISDFCYPSGKYDERTINKLKETGYKTAATVKSGIVDQNSSLYELPRIRVQNDTNMKKIFNF